jgi:hypothetical protein
MEVLTLDYNMGSHYQDLGAMGFSSCLVVDDSGRVTTSDLRPNFDRFPPGGADYVIGPGKTVRRPRKVDDRDD